MPRAASLLVAALLSAMSGWSADRGAPSYSAATIVNSASNEVGFFSPNTFLTIYGANLAYTSRAMADIDIHGNLLPTILPGTGVTVFINRVRVPIYYVSPTQLNILIPTDVSTGTVQVQVALDGLYGPAVNLPVQRYSPALFQADGQTAIGLHADGRLISNAAPGRSGEYITLYATGLGPTLPPTGAGEIPMTAAVISKAASFMVLLDGAAVGAERILYVGVAPGFAGLYQINVRLPDSPGRSPEVRLQVEDQLSRAGVRLPLEP